MSDLALHVPREFRRGGRANDEADSVNSAYGLIRLMCDKLGIPSLEGKTVLDMGCGTKLVQAILTRELPVGHYVGCDVYAEMIDYLRANVDDPRFEFHPLNFHNEMYNPDGEPLSAESRLPVEENSFDIICLFSVFTHLAPHDYNAMLKVLRRYIKPGGHLLYSLFVNELTDGGHGFMDRMLPHIMEKLSKDKELAKTEPKDFVDWDPNKPLWRAIYSRRHALELIEGTGWQVESLNEPEEYIQHYMVCTPQD